MTEEDLELASLLFPFWKPKFGDPVWVWVGPSYSADKRKACLSWWRRGEVSYVGRINPRTVSAVTKNKIVSFVDLDLGIVLPMVSDD